MKIYKTLSERVKMYKPDFENLKNVLLCRDKNGDKNGDKNRDKNGDKNRDKKCVPLIELHIDEGFKEKYFSKKPLSLEDEVRFSLEHCHDFILAAKGILKPAKTIGNQTEKDGMTWADEDDGLIRTIGDLENYDWMDPAKEDYSVFMDAKKVMPQDMKIIATGGKIFTATWMLMSFNNFCISTIENPGLVKKVFSKVGQIQFEVFSRIIEFDTVGAFAAVDDIAYTEGLMISADILRENVFPWYKKMGQICKKKNIPFIYHSDGRIWEIIDDLLDCGFNAIHPIEPKAMSIKEVQDKYKDRLCLLGNIEMDTLIRGSSKDVEKLVLNNLKNIAGSGFYACGSSNTITSPMPVGNVRAMVDTVRKFGSYPIKI